ncbi:bifunctional cytochrome P450/NADPH--P450 reductase [Metabacillus sp. GX 13764]|uniref:bifunctional cytochrome P450/NADPH--P450 reductase n=1 Tax=Metabacillus kandeliae TaxID=2900151 RepID=UPI001E2AA3C5|nr:bifunctional cytochrome P450/NADPH--P450 reductase [Metabacillus kandeliae]MCD7035827.1 bifunctional cytochrome P450/NADPH--P450 reductase [Metabacillus kandeliae]
MNTLMKIPNPELTGAVEKLPPHDPQNPVQWLMKTAEIMGPIFQLQTPERMATYVTSREFAAEVSDEKRFAKSVSPALQNVREFAGDGLFTSWTHEPNWKKAHNILLPSFSQKAMKGYHSMMADIAVQLVQKWERLNPGEEVEVSDDMTRLTLDTIGLCGFNYRFNSFYKEKNHPFVDCMVRSLGEAMNRVASPDVPEERQKQFQDDISYMFGLVDFLIEERKKSGENPGDLLSHMLNSTDPETGERLDDENIRFQIITFLIAGHETTSGLLSFTLYYLLKNKEKLQKTQAEADRVLTDPIPDYKQVKKLKYIQMVLNEALRLWPTAPGFSIYAKGDQVLGEKYMLKEGQEVFVILPQLHRDKAVWGENADEFLPERFEDMSRIPQHAFKPFGNGQRACIGQQFALHEATMILGMLLKHFDFTDHKNYQLKVKETLTLKPEGFTMQVKSRKRPLAAVNLKEEAPAVSSTGESSAQVQPKNAHLTPLLVLYGSNMGTAEGIAKELADAGTAQGYQTEAAPLDEHAGKLPKEGAVIIVTSSYNGTPPDNAMQFIDWLESAKSEELAGVRYAVFGCGDRNWASTYQKVPLLIDELLSSKGAESMLPRGEGDADSDFELQYESWKNELWPETAKKLGLLIEAEAQQTAKTVNVEFVGHLEESPIAKNYQAFSAEVLKNEELQSANSPRSTRHIELALPQGTLYKEGDHLGILPENSFELVSRALSRFGLTGSEKLKLSGKGSSFSHLPLNKAIGARELLSAFTELQEPATRAQLRALASHTVCPPHKAELEELLDDGLYRSNVLNKRLTMLDFLEQYPACEMSLGTFLALLPPLKPRYYSISSSLKAAEGLASITVSIVREEAWSGKGEYKGVASNYLAGLSAGERVLCFIKSQQTGFSLPENAETPIIMVGPGTGVAPYRGFLQARRALKASGQTLGEAHLYFGCRSKETDYLYREELEQAEKDGLVSLHTAFSRVAGKPKTYVQHLMEQDGPQLIKLLEKGACLYICGDGSRMAPDVENMLLNCYQKEAGVSEEEAQSFLAGLQKDGRYSLDVWAG